MKKDLEQVPLRGIVGIGASAGGLQPLERLFKAMPRQTGCAFVVVQHLSPDFKSLMDDLLGRQTEIPVIKAETGMRLQADCIYLPPPATQVTFADGCFVIAPSQKESGGSTRIDSFLRHLAEAFKEMAIAIILSGSGGDGAQGVRAVQREGGFVICQDPAEAQFESMPQSAIRTECVDAVLPVEKIPEILRLHISDPTATFRAREGNQVAEADMAPMSKLFGLLKNHLGIQFSEYKESTVARRILRRVALHETRDIAGYVEWIEKEGGEELDALYHDLLIGVTEFFRDEESFVVLRDNLRDRLAAKLAHEEIRVWVAGCATGQEAYSLAILLDEIKTALDLPNKVILYATDAHRGSLATAANGVYSNSCVAGLSAERLGKYFEAEPSGGYRIRDKYRRMVVFAPHNLLSDPPFTRLDLISCRNVLIYLKQDAQSRLLRSFNYGLLNGGLLFLGASEGLSHLAEYFEVKDTRAKIFTKTRLIQDLPLFGDQIMTKAALPRAVPTVTSPNSVRIERSLLMAYDTILMRHMPPGLLLSEDGEILHYFGVTEKFLGPMQGRPSKDVIARVDGQLKVALMTLLQRIRNGEAHVEFYKVQHTAAKSGFLNLRADVIFDAATDKRMVHVVFEMVPEPVAEEIAGPAGGDAVEGFAMSENALKRIKELESELNSTRENLQATIEELQTSNEELQTSNEEMIASNEELQSTNEELQSVNEELYTVNAEFSQKNDQLTLLNAEHRALLESLDIGLIFIDKDLRIRKYNRAIQNIMQLLPQDIGRPLEHLATFLEQPQELLAAAGQVFADGEAQEREVFTRSGGRYSQRIVPFAHSDGDLEGVVITFTDVLKIRQAEAALRLSEERLSLAALNARQGLWEANLLEGSCYFSPSWHQLLGYGDKELTGRMDTWNAMVHPEDRRRWMRFFRDSCREDTDFSIQMRLALADGTYRWFLCRGRVVARNEGQAAVRVIGFITDISEIKKLEMSLREVDRRLEMSLQSAQQVWWEWDLQEKILITHGVDHCILGYDCLEVDNHEDFWWSRIPEEEIPQVRDSLERHFSGEEKQWRCDHRYRAKDGHYRWVIDSGQVIERDENGQPLRMIGITQLNHAQKLAYLELDRSRAFYQSIVDHQGELICRFDGQLKLVFANRALSRFFDRPIESFKGISRADLLSAPVRKHVRGLLLGLTPNNRSFNHIDEWTDAEGKSRWIEWTEFAFFDADNKLECFQAVGREITERKRAEQRLTDLLQTANDARQLAEAANRSKSEFLAVMNHELRTPLNPIIAGSELLAESLSDGENRAIVDMISSAGQHLLQLVNSLLDLSKLDSGKVNPVIEPFLTEELISGLRDLFTSTIYQKSLEFKVKRTDAVPEFLMSDVSILRQILIHLLSNAEKFTFKGSVGLVMDFVPLSAESDTGTLILSVSDTGIGIPQSLQGKIFDEFLQGDSGATRRFGGTGIGLAISKKMANLLGGDLTVSSAEGVGSTFTLQLPVKVYHDQGAEVELDAEIDLQRMKSAKVLVVDDDPTNRKIIAAILQPLVEHLDVAVDGIEAVQQVRHCQYDVVFMDIHMPHMNGFETARAILAQDYKSAPPKIIFITADTRDEIRHSAQQADAAAILSKPVRVAELHRVFAHVLQELHTPERVTGKS